MSLPDLPSERRLLRGWKEIGAYLGAAPRSAQRYAAELGLPVHRAGASRGSVSAYTDELDAWVRRRSDGRKAASDDDDATAAGDAPGASPAGAAAPEVYVPSTGRRWAIRAGLVLAVAATSVVIWATLGRDGAFPARDARAGSLASVAPGAGRRADTTYRLWVRYPNGSTASLGTSERHPATVQLAPGQVVVLQPTPRGDRLRIDVYQQEELLASDGQRQLFATTELGRSPETAPQPVTFNMEVGTLELAWVGGGK